MPRIGAGLWLCASVLSLGPDAIAEAKTAVQPAPAAASAAQFHPELRVFRAPGKIKIDGDLSDSGWIGALPAMNFSEHSPGEEVEPPVKTKAFVTFDESHLYVSAICYAEPGSVRASVCEREQIFNDDNIGFFFDTYGDASRAYIINLNPYGIPYDALWTPGWGEDGNFDLLFESSGKVTDSGYQVEAAIPFRSLRFPNQNVQDWKFDFYRHHLREEHYSMSWARYDQNEACWPCRWGTVRGIEGVKPGKGLELIGSVVSSQSGEVTDYNDPDASFVNNDVMTSVGAGVRYAPTSDIAFEGTVNPDFSQIEADASQVDVNTTFALQYPEKRPFFQEGIDALRTNFNLVYTRTINDPDFAAKGSAKLGKTSVTLLSSSDAHTFVIVPFEERSETVEMGESYSNLIALRQAFGNDNHVRLLATDRRHEGGGSGSLASLDMGLRFTRALKWRAQAVYTNTEEAELGGSSDSTTFDHGKHTAAFDGESFSGSALLTGLEYDGRRLYADLSLYGRSPTYRAENGFQPRNDDRQANFSTSYLFRPNGAVFSQIELGGNVGTIYNSDEIKKDEWLVPWIWTSLPFYQATFSTEVLLSEELFGGVYFDNIYHWSTNFSLTPGNMASFGGGYTYGRRIARNFLTMGNETNAEFWLNLRPLSRLQAEYTLEYSRSADVESGTEYFAGYISRLRLSYQFTKRLSLRLVNEYDAFSNAWGMDPLITYRINPFSVFYLGSTYDYLRFEELTTPGAQPGTRLQARQFFVKLQYLFMT